MGSQIRSLRDVAQATFEAVAPVADELGDGPYFERLGRLAADPSHDRQRRAAEAGGPQAAVRQLAEELAADLGETARPEARHPHP